MQVNLHGLGPLNWPVRRGLRLFLRRHLRAYLERHGRQIIADELKNSYAVAAEDASFLSAVFPPATII